MLYYCTTLQIKVSGKNDFELAKKGWWFVYLKEKITKPEILQKFAKHDL